MKITKSLIQRMLKFIFYTAAIALILTPVIPWVTEGHEYREHDIWYSKPEISESEDGNISMINQNINYASMGFLFGIVFTLVCNVGVIMRKVKKHRLADYLMFTSIPILISSIVALAFSIRVFYLINDLGEPYSFGYNYSQIFLSIPFFFVSLIFAIIVAPRAMKSIAKRKEKERRIQTEHDFDAQGLHENGVPPTQKGVPPTQKDVPPTQKDVPPTQKDVPPTQKDVPPSQTQEPPTQDHKQEDIPEEKSPTLCRYCGTSINDDALVCPNCGNNLSIRCPGCGTLYPEHNGYCPECTENG